MRIQMKLSGDTVSAMNVASFYITGRDWAVSRGEIVEYVVKKYGDNYKEIDWTMVEKPSVLPVEEGLQTAFELSERTVAKLDEIQKYFSEIFEAKRNVYKPFVLKLLLFKLLNDFEEDARNSELVVDSNVVGLSTCNFGDETNKLDKEKRLSTYYQLMTGEEIIAFQEYNVGKDGKWLKWWEEEYKVLAPEGIEKHPEIHFASVTLVEKNSFISFEPLKLATKNYWNRYVYGILTIAPNRRLRYLNIHIPQSVKYENETEKQHEERVKNIEELWQAVIKEIKEKIDCPEEWIVTGDFNAYEDSRFSNYLKELKSLLVDIDVTFQGEFITNTWKDRKLDYIFADRRTALKFICEAEADDRVVRENVTDHSVLTTHIVAKRTVERGGMEL